MSENENAQLVMRPIVVAVEETAVLIQSAIDCLGRLALQRRSQCRLTPRDANAMKDELFEILEELNDRKVKGAL